MKKIVKVLIFFCILGLGMSLFSGCNTKTEEGLNWLEDGGKAYVEAAKAANVSGKNPVVTMVVKDYGTIVMELYPQKAPQAVYNFIELIQKNFYDGLTFHRIMEGFMVQGGDPDGTGGGGPGYNIKGEFLGNRFQYNDLKHERGVLSMARAKPADSAGSQFFIMHADNSGLDGAYAAFGKVTEGMEVVDKMVKVPVKDDNGTLADPSQAPIIEKMTVDTFGDAYPSPTKYDDNGNVKK